MGKLRKFVAKAVLCLSTLSSFVPNSRVGAKLNSNSCDYKMSFRTQAEILKDARASLKAYADIRGTHMARWLFGVESLIGPDVMGWRESEMLSMTYRQMQGASIKWFKDSLSDPARSTACNILAYSFLNELETNKSEVPCALLHFPQKDGNSYVMHDVVMYKGISPRTNKPGWVVYDGFLALHDIGVKGSYIEDHMADYDVCTAFLITKGRPTSTLAGSGIREDLNTYLEENLYMGNTEYDKMCKRAWGGLLRCQGPGAEEKADTLTINSGKPFYDVMTEDFCKTYGIEIDSKFIQASNTI